MEGPPMDSDVTPEASYEQKLTQLRDSILHKPPFTSGSLQLSPSDLSLFYKVNKDEHIARLGLCLDAIARSLQTLIITGISILSMQLLNS
jgi:hypothetical protein